MCRVRQNLEQLLTTHKRLVLLCWLFAAPNMYAEEAEKKQETKLTVLVEGAHCDACVRAVCAKLDRVKGVKLETDDIYRGEKPKYFSDPFLVRFGKTTESRLGAVSKATAAAKTPHASDVPPRLHLVLFSKNPIDEDSVSALRMALSQTNGVLVFESGGLGAFIDKGWYWIRLDPAGGADLEDIMQAAKKAGTFQLLDPNDD